MSKLIFVSRGVLSVLSDKNQSVSSVDVTLDTLLHGVSCTISSLVIDVDRVLW